MEQESLAAWQSWKGKEPTEPPDLMARRTILLAVATHPLQ